jgi:hypothetical protein
MRFLTRLFAANGTLLLSIGALLMAAACNDNGNSEPEPASLAAFIEGESFLADSITVSVVESPNDTTYFGFATRDVEQDTLILRLRSPLNFGTYPYGTGGTLTGNQLEYVDSAGTIFTPDIDINNPAQGDTGKIVIEQVSGGRFGGSFSGTVTSTNGARQISITGGEFERFDW